MSKRTEAKERKRQAKRAAKASALSRKGRSEYAKKMEYLNSNRWNPMVDDMPSDRKSRRLFGFEVPDPKPWK